MGFFLLVVILKSVLWREVLDIWLGYFIETKNINRDNHVTHHCSSSATTLPISIKIWYSSFCATPNRPTVDITEKLQTIVLRDEERLIQVCSFHMHE